MNSKWDIANELFSGQGVVLVARRDDNGDPLGFENVGDVTDLKIAMATTVQEYKETQSGQRGTAKRLETEKKVNLSMTGTNFSSANFARVVRGEATDVTGSTVAAELVSLRPGYIVGLGRMDLSSIVLSMNSVALIKYVDEATPWDYKENQDHGSVKFNDGVDLAVDKMGTAVTAVSAASSAVFTVASTTGLNVGDTVKWRGFAGTDLIFFNTTNPSGVVTAKTSTTFTIGALDSTGKTVTYASSKAYWDGQVVSCAYTFGDQVQVAALSEGQVELYMRFEGLNTAESNEAVLIEVWKFATDPAKELALIGDTFQSFVLDGSVLADANHTDSQYYRVTKLG